MIHLHSAYTADMDAFTTEHNLIQVTDPASRPGRVSGEPVRHRLHSGGVPPDRGRCAELPV